MIRAVIFDCFGVLAEDGWLPFKRQYIGGNTQLATEVADLGKQNEYGMLDNYAFIKQASARIGIDENILRSAVGRQTPNQELFDFIRNELKPAYKIGLLSNANYDVTKELFTPEQAQLFDASVLSYECRMVKPDERMFELITTRLGVAPEECVYVDDLERYSAAAELFGMRAVVYESPQQCKAEIRKLL